MIFSCILSKIIISCLVANAYKETVAYRTDSTNITDGTESTHSIGGTWPRDQNFTSIQFIFLKLY